MACGVNGDVITLLQLKVGLSFKETLEYLAKRAGLDINNNQNNNFKSPKITKLSISNNEYEQYTDIYKSFIDLCSNPTGKARQWLYDRGFTDNTIDRMKIKWADSPDQILIQLRSVYSSDRLLGSGLVNKSGKLFCYDHKFIWTYFIDYKPVYFQGRAICKDIKPKEMNISKPVPFPYNIDVLKQNPHTVIVCEGVIDTLSLIEHDFLAIGVIGVQGFKDKWLTLLKNVKVKVAFDADLAGQQASEKLVIKMKNFGIDAESVILPGGFDINRFFLVIENMKDAKVI